MWIVILMYALFASTFTAGKHILEITSPFFFTGIRMLLAGLILIGIQAIRNPRSLYIPKAIWPYLISLGVLNVFITNAFEYWGMLELESSKACLIYSLSPLFSIIFSYFFFKEKMSYRKWLGMGVGFLGFIPIFFVAQESSSFFKLPTMHECALIISAFTSVIGWMSMKALISKHNFSYVAANLYSFFIGGIIAMIWASCTETLFPLPIYPLSLFVPEMIFIVLIHNVLCYNIYSYSLGRFSVTFMTFAGFVSPLFAEFFGWYILGESLSWMFFLSLLLILSGLTIYVRAEKREFSESQIKAHAA